MEKGSLVWGVAVVVTVKKVRGKDNSYVEKQRVHLQLFLPAVVRAVPPYVPCATISAGVLEKSPFFFPFLPQY